MIEAENNDSPKSPSPSRSFEGREGGNERSREDRGSDRAKGGPMEVIVDHSVEKAIKILKRKLIKEGLFKELKARRYYEKPSERKKRKTKESLKKARKEEARAKKNNMLF